MELAPKVSVAFMKKKNEVLSDKVIIISMLFRVEIVSLCVWHKSLAEIDKVSSFHMNLMSLTHNCFSPAFCQQRHLCI